MNKNKNILNMLETVERIFEATNSAVEGMNEGDRIQLKELAQTVGLAVAMEPKNVLSFVNHFVHNSDIAYVTRGKNGGVIRGSKNSKVIKSIKNTKSTRDPSVELVDPADDLEE